MKEKIPNAKHSSIHTITVSKCDVPDLVYVRHKSEVDQIAVLKKSYICHQVAPRVHGPDLGRV